MFSSRYIFFSKHLKQSVSHLEKQGAYTHAEAELSELKIQARRNNIDPYIL